MIVYDLFVHKKSVWKRKVCIIKNLKKPKKNQKKKNIFSGFFRWVFWVFWVGFFLGGFFWVGFLMPTLSLGLHKGRPNYRRSLQLSKENIQHFKTWNFLIFFYFCGSFLPAWIRIPNTDPNPDPLTWLNPDPIGPILIRIRNPGGFSTTVNVMDFSGSYHSCRSGFGFDP